MPDESILKRLTKECESFSELLTSKTCCVKLNKLEPSEAPVVRKRGRPRKHFPTDIPDKNMTLPFSPGPPRKPHEIVVKKKRKRKVKDYPWGSIKKKRKVLSDVSLDWSGTPSVIGH